MQIASVDVEVLQASDDVLADPTAVVMIVRVRTEDGLEGVGDSATSAHVAHAIIEAPSSFGMRGVRDVLVGRDPREVAVLWEELYRLTAYGARRGAYVHALSAIDVALWDLFGKATGIPIHMLLGGAVRREVPAYASHVLPATPAEATQLAAAAVERGFRALKAGWLPVGSDEATDLAFVRALRDGAGPDVRVMIDVGPRWSSAADLVWDAKTAIDRVRRFAEYDVFWVEEPLPADDLDGYARLTRGVETRIAAGEAETTRFDLLDLMDRGGIDVVQPDIARVGGLTEARRVAHAAQDRGRLFAPHCFNTAILIASSLHLCAAMPHAVYLEYPISTSPVLRRLVHPPIEPVDGVVRVPEGPGLGVELDEELVAHLRVEARR
jgi:L-rhamnonate dehydratase